MAARLAIRMRASACLLLIRSNSQGSRQTDTMTSLVARPNVRFQDKFIAGYFVAREISHEILADARSLSSFLRYVFEDLRDSAQWQIHGHLEPSEEQRDAYTDSLMRLPPWKFDSPPPPPWKDWRTEALPEPIFTNIAPTNHETVRIVIVFGGVLRPEFAGDGLPAVQREIAQSSAARKTL